MKEYLEFGKLLQTTSECRFGKKIYKRCHVSLKQIHVETATARASHASGNERRGISPCSARNDHHLQAVCDDSYPWTNTSNIHSADRFRKRQQRIHYSRRKRVTLPNSERLQAHDVRISRLLHGNLHNSRIHIYSDTREPRHIHSDIHTSAGLNRYLRIPLTFYFPLTMSGG